MLSDSVRRETFIPLLCNAQKRDGDSAVFLAGDYRMPSARRASSNSPWVGFESTCPFTSSVGFCSLPLLCCLTHAAAVGLIYIDVVIVDFTPLQKSTYVLGVVAPVRTVNLYVRHVWSSLM